MNKKFGIGAIFATILLLTISFVPIVSAKENATEELAFGPGTLNELKSNQDFIAAYGNIPAFGCSDERDQLIDTLDTITQEVSGNFEGEMSKYFYPNGPVTSYGYTIDGVIEVGINRSKTVDKSFMEEIYQFFDSKARNFGVKDVPVVFMHEDNPVPAVIIEPLEPDNGNISNINNSSGNKSSKINSAPGLGLLGSLTCLYGGRKLRKK